MHSAAADQARKHGAPQKALETLTKAVGKRSVGDVFLNRLQTLVERFDSVQLELSANCNYIDGLA